MVRIACVLIADPNFRSIAPQAATFVAEAELSMTVAAFTEMIHPVLCDRHGFPIHHLSLFLATKDQDDACLSACELRPSDVERVSKFMEPTKLLSECLGPAFQLPASGEVQVLVLAQGSCRPVMRPFNMTLQDKCAKVLASAHRTGVLPTSLGDTADVDLWTIDECGQMKDLTSWRFILPSLPAAYLVRMEALMVWRVFRETFQQRLDSENGVDTNSVTYKATHGHQSGELRQHRCLSLWGSPGVGKSVLLTLMCIWLAVKQKRDVVLLRYVGWELRATLLAGQSGRYYEWECCDFGLWGRELVGVRIRHFVNLLKRVNKPERAWVCADRVAHNAFHNTFRGVAFDIWSAHGDVDASAVHCLVPFWTQSDLKTLGILRGFDDEECARRYAVSGGSVGQFLKSINDAKHSIDRVLREPAWDSIAKLRRIEADCRQVVHMHTVLDRTVLGHYVDGTFQREVLMSDYARQRLGLCEEVYGIFRRRYERDELAL